MPSLLATIAVGAFVGMLIIAVVCFAASVIEKARPGSVLPRGRVVEDHPTHPVRDLISGRSLQHLGWFGRLAWLGMWLGFVAVFGVFVGVPWSAIEGGRAQRQAQEIEQELVTRQCGDHPLISPTRRILEGVIDGDPIVKEEVVRIGREYSDCRARALGHEPLPRLAEPTGRGVPF